jgi:CheY-like chemotaxis protein
MDKAVTRTRLVLVEDNQDCLEAFSVILGERYAVFGYASAFEALQAIDAAKPDVLLLDIGMHPVDGVQCLRMIRATPGYRHVPALALTGFARDVERQAFLDAGFQAVAVKPILDHAELVAVIDRLVNPAAPAALRTSTHPGRRSPLPTLSASAPATDLDGGAVLTASGPGESGKTDGRQRA